MRQKHTLVIALVVALIFSSLGVTAAQDDGETAWLGVAVRDDPGGARVETVLDDSPAAGAGIREGDVITAVDDTTIDGAEHLVDVIAAYAPGDTVVITVLRDDDELDLDVTLAERPADLDTIREPEIDIRTLPPLRGRMNLFGLDLEMTGEGLRVGAIDADSPLAEAGLQEDDLITAINGEALTGLLPHALMRALDEGEITLSVQRDGEEITLTLRLTDLLDEVPVPFMFVQPGAAPRPTQLGVAFTILDAELAAEEGLEVEQGALIREVYDSTPAAEAGLQAGDVITAVDGDIVDEERTLTDRLYAYEEGDVVTLSVLREGEELELEVTLGPRNAPHSMYFRGMMPFEDWAWRDAHPGQGFGRGMQRFKREGMRGMMPFFLHPELRGKLGQDFFELHPFLGELFENVPDDAPGAEGDVEVTPDVPGSSA